ncbi:proteasome maturation factor UMP1 [Cyathus striatus]|nr:proteasome maturation factor UMP1 [Cyathus striatus]
MEPSLRIVPAQPTKSASVSDTANSLGLHDTLQYGPLSLSAQVKSEGGLKDRLNNWEETQDNVRLTLQRNIYGMHAPMRLLMERKIVTAGSHLPVMPQSNLHLDILMGRDELIDTADIFLGADGAPIDLHREMEKRTRM